MRAAAKDAKERANRARRRQLLHLALDFLRDEGLHKSADALVREADLDEDSTSVCDNVDLDSILRDYCDYFQLRFDKQPQICRSRTDGGRRKTTEGLDRARPEEAEEKGGGAILPNEPSGSWEDAVGCDGAKACLLEALSPVGDYPHLFPGGAPPWRGVLLHGPPGNGKTTLARAAAAVSRRTFFDVSPADAVSKWRGESEKFVKALFESARLNAPSVVFFDEVDALASSRGGPGEHEASRRLKAELLVELDRLPGDVLFLAATNLPWDVDPALLRRTDKRISVPAPDFEARSALIRARFDETNSRGVDPEKTAGATAGYSCSDVRAVCKEAAMEVVRRTSAEGGRPRSARVSQSDLDAAVRRIRPSSDERLAARHLEWSERNGAE